MAGTKNAKQARATASTQPAGHAGTTQHSDQPKRVPPAPRRPTNAELLAIDGEALGRTGGWQGRTHTLADWMGGRNACPHPLDDQPHTPCDAEKLVNDRAWYRNNRAERALANECAKCEDSTRWKFASVLKSWRPGARQPWESCEGCPFSYLGEIEPDASIVDAYRGCTPRDERQPRQIPASKPHLRSASRAQRQGIDINGARQPLKCKLWRGEFNSAGFAVVQRKDQRCLVIALVLRKKLRRPIRPGHAPRLLCGNHWCVAEECVVEQYVPRPRAEIVNVAGDTSQYPTGATRREEMTEAELEQVADEILEVYRSTVHSRRAYYAERELRELAKRDIHYGDDMQRFGLSEDNGVVFGGAEQHFEMNYDRHYSERGTPVSYVDDGDAISVPHFWFARPDLTRFGPLPQVVELALQLVLYARLKRQK